MNVRDKNVLKHILEYCEKLISYTEGTDFCAFKDDSLRKDACALSIMQIGELVHVLTDEFKDANPEIPWRQIRSMRNIVAHHYGTVDYETVWDTIQNDIPALKAFCKFQIAGADTD